MRNPSGKATTTGPKTISIAVAGCQSASGCHPYQPTAGRYSKRGRRRIVRCQLYATGSIRPMSPVRLGRRNALCSESAVMIAAMMSILLHWNPGDAVA